LESDQHKHNQVEICPMCYFICSWLVQEEGV